MQLDCMPTGHPHHAVTSAVALHAAVHFFFDALLCALQGVIPSQPDAWVWLGDITYMDDPLMDCSQVPTFPECNCTADFMRRPPFGCAHAFCWLEQLR